MKLNHFHVFVKDLEGCVKWLDAVWGLNPSYKSDIMASFHQDGFTFIVDVSENDVSCTLGFESSNCDDDFKSVTDKGATVIEEPNDKPWGVRAAYIKGPGALTFEIEQMLNK